MPTPVAQYLRMSTEHQQYSLMNQSARIQQYAEEFDFTIVETYSDAAKSGVILGNRSGLLRLLKDVMGGNVTYRAILVYDISRWGRFQDADEAAHYEFLCKSSGVPVHYCAEQFPNDGTIPSTILKSLKRSMAAEYSRELGVKTFAGQKRICELGFRLGSSPGYGLRRFLVSTDHEPKHALRPKEWKSITTDRVILVPGPQEEVDVVREIYRMLIFDDMPVLGIAAELNRRRIKYLGPSAWWSNHAVYRILTSPKYAGFSVYGRTTAKLKTAVVNKAPSEWTITPNAFPAIVDRKTFVAAQQVLAARSLCNSKYYLLNRLEALLATKGKLSREIIEKSKLTPSPGTYGKVFGGLTQAYALVGAKMVRTPRRDWRLKRQSLRESLLAQVESKFPDRIRVIRGRGSWRAHLVVDNDYVVSMCIAAVRETLQSGLRWRYNPTLREYGNFILLARPDKESQTFLDLFVFPPALLTHGMNLSLRDRRLRKGTRLQDLSQLPQIVNVVAGQHRILEASV